MLVLNDFLNTLSINVKASLLTIVIPVVFFVSLFIGSKRCNKKEFDEDFLSKKQTNTIKGFCAAGIILHHLAQKTAAPWLNSQYIIHGLDFFVNIGYLFVGTFLFISGYGLYKSYKTNDSYFDNYFSRRIFPLTIAYIMTSLIYYIYYPISSTYTWYVFAILVCYILFYLGFKNIKKEYISFTIVTIGIVLYSVICNFFMLGGWWYNTIGLFVIGLVFAKFEKGIVSFIKKVYLPFFVLCIVITIACNMYGRYYEVIIFNVKEESIYNLYSLYIIIFRFIAAIGFTFTIILIALKFRFNSRIYTFYGFISLEFYLIQGLFVQMFSYCYFNESIEPLYYIKSIPLYIIVVISISTAVAYLLSYTDGKIKQFLLFLKEKRKTEIDFVLKAVKKLFIIMGIVILAYILFHTERSLKETVNSKEAIAMYEEKYISYVDVGEKKMAAYIVGNGKDTLVLMRGNNDPCPSLSMRLVADKLSEDYKVVVLDYLGTGFSDKPDTERTSKNIIKEIHDALHEFGITKNYILIPEYISGIYAQEYVKEYKNEVKAVIALETENLPERKLILASNGVSSVEYHKRLQLKNKIKFVLGRLMSIKGIDTLIWEVNKEYYKQGLEKDELIVARELFFDNIYNSTFLNENKNELSNINNSFSAQYPRQTYVYDIINYEDNCIVERMGRESEDLHAEICFDRSKHKTKIINGLRFAMFNEPEEIKTIIDEAIETMK